MPNFFEELRYIVTNSDTEIAIWNNEHYNEMNEVKKIEDNINLLIDESLNIGFLSKIQHTLIRLIEPKIKNIFTTNTIYASLYDHKDILLPTNNEFDYYFNLIEIIFYKSINNNQIDLTSNNIGDLLTNEYYLDSINNLKLLYKNSSCL